LKELREGVDFNQRLNSENNLYHRLLRLNSNREANLCFNDITLGVEAEPFKNIGSLSILNETSTLNETNKDCENESSAFNEQSKYSIK
jgi:hypothetical protein